MKAQSFLLILFLSSNICYSQNNFPLIQPGKVWSIANHNPHSLGVSTSAFKFENDTIINGKSYYFIYESYLDSTFSNWYMLDNWFIREDSLGNIYTLVNNVEQQLYDFNLKVGDSIFTGYHFGFHDVYAIVDIVDSVLINGTSRKRIVFDSYFNEIWIKGIGSLTHILYPFSRTLSTFVFNLLCVKQNGYTIYQNPQYEDCFLYIVGFSEKRNQKVKVIITPNPLINQSVVEILNSSGESTEMHIINSFGKTIRNISFFGNQCIILKDGFSPGIYLVKLLINNYYYTSKLIIE